METVRLGCKGDAVKALQSALHLTADGVFGPATEEAVKAFQKRHKLSLDGIVGPKTWELLERSDGEEEKEDVLDGAIGGIVEYLPINVHITECEGREPQYIVIHYTAGTRSCGDADKGTRKVFLSREASADFVVDDDSILQVNPDCLNYYCWAVGDKMVNGKKRTIYNRDCISIEVCSSLNKGFSPAYANHEGWYFTDESVENALTLTRMLMERFGIDKEHVIRHFDVTGKLCPGIPGWNTGMLVDNKTGKQTGKRNTEDKWLAFKASL